MSISSPTRLFATALLAALLCHVTFETAVGQTAAKRDLSLEDIFLNDLFKERSFESGKWMDSGPVIAFVAETSPGVKSIVQYDLAAGDTTVVVDGSALNAKDVGRLIVVDDFAFSADGKKVLIYTDSEKVWRLKTKGYYYVYDLETGSLTPVSDRELGFQMFAKFNPDATEVGFVRQRNIFVVDLATGDERKLTKDGSPGGIINGTSDWVYEEELGLRNAWHWSPDGKYIAFLQLDETRTRDYWLTNFLGQYPEFKRFRYPKAGEANSEIRPASIEVETGEITYFDTDTWYAGGDEHEYLSQIGWTPPIDGSAKIWVFRMNRDQNDLDLMYLDPATGETRVVMNESEPTYIYVKTGFSDLDAGKLTYLQDGEHFVWISEVDGFRHLFLYENDGNFVRQLTRGDWQVAAFEGVAEDSGLVYFTATIEHPTQRQLYRVPLAADAASGSEPERITQGHGWHDVNLSADRKYFIDTYSNLSTPTTVTLRTADGDELAVLEDNAELNERLSEYRMPSIELTELPGADSTMLNAYIIRPRSFSRMRKYPLLLYIYGGPGSQEVRDSWRGPRGLWHRYLADRLDMIVVCVDGRGTGGRGKAFQALTYKQLGVLEAQDFIAVARELGGRDYIDESRMGIWGKSYGGFMTLNSLLMGDGPETFKVGVSVAPVTDWRQYDTIYTERYMSTPQKNPEGYRIGSPITYADRLGKNQKLLIVHGTADDNVHLQNSIQMIDALEKAGKQFRFMVYPGKTHSLAGAETQMHLFTLITNFLGENL